MTDKMLMQRDEYPFEFSVIMAVYNVEPFLQEAVDSLISQDFGFRRIQLIMVDDGSSDNSGAICDKYAKEYPENIIVIHKENGGVASARNEGLKYATGRYLNFMDSDDKFTRNTFREVYHFFQGKEKEIDIVTIPLEFFDAQHGPHWQNGKFAKGTRILDLYWDYQATLMFVNASFFVNEVKDEICFDPHLVCGEDMKVLLTILARKMKMGVVSCCKYMYRRRSVGEASLIQSAKKKYGWYFDYFTYLVDWAVEFYKEKFGYLPAFLQYELLTDLQWRFKEKYSMEEVLTLEEIELYKERLFRSLQYFDDKYIMELKMVWNEHKCYMLSKKYSCPAELTERYSNAIVHFGNTKINSIADQYSKLEFIKVSGNLLTIEGFMKVFGAEEQEDFRIYLKVNDELYPCVLWERESIQEYRFEELIFRGIAFRAELPLYGKKSKFEIQFILQYRNSLIVRRDIRVGEFSPIGKKYSNAYYYSDGWLLQMKGHTLYVKNCSHNQLTAYERRFQKELWDKNQLGGRKAVIARKLYWILKKLKRKPIWLVSDRIMMAGDNGEVFFRYLIEHHSKDIVTYFVISKNSPDYEKIKQIGPVVNALSLKHKLLHLLCDFNISSQADRITSNPFLGYEDNYRDILWNPKFVFLQHGVTKDDLSEWLNRFSKNLSGFVTAARPEFNSILNGDYYYTQQEVWLTGFPRFDRLYQDEKNIITIMPTWRAYLVDAADQATGVWPLKDGFVKSDFYVFYNSLINHPKLLKKVQEFGYKIQIKLHPAFQSHTNLFEKNDCVQFVENNKLSYCDIFAHSNLLITDYSSTVFDFAYLRKPIIYCQFDSDKFFSGEHMYVKGYFDYEQDGFGEVEYSLENTVDRIIEYIENGCQLKDQYRKRIEKFFAFHDQNNCERVYKRIMELNRGDKV